MSPRRPFRSTLISNLGVLLLLALAACGGDSNGPRVVGQDGSAIDVGTPTETPPATPTVTPTAATPADGTPSPTPTVPTATGTPSPTATPTRTPSATPTTTPSGGTTAGDDGSPYGTASVRAAVERGGGTFQVDDEQESLCPGSAVPGTTFRAYGSTWVLWVYPSADAREDDWSLDGGRLEPQVSGCELPTGYNYFNANLVVALVEQGGDPGDMRDAFLGLTP